MYTNNNNILEEWRSNDNSQKKLNSCMMATAIPNLGSKNNISAIWSDFTSMFAKQCVPTFSNNLSSNFILQQNYSSKKGSLAA